VLRALLARKEFKGPLALKVPRALKERPACKAAKALKVPRDRKELRVILVQQERKASWALLVQRGRKALPSTPALSGVLETLGFFRDPDFARSRFERYGDVYETSLLGQRTVFIRGGQAIGDLFAQGDAVQGWWPDSVRELLGPLSLANRNGADHKARRRVVGQLFASAALKRYSPTIVALVNELSQELLASDAPVDLVPKLRRFAFSVIASTVLGLNPIDRKALFVDFETWCQGLFSLPLALPGSPYARARQARQRLLKRL
jgi:cytochrome P450